MTSDNITAQLHENMYYKFKNKSNEYLKRLQSAKKIKA